MVKQEENLCVRVCAEIQFGDDAKGLKVVPYADLTKLRYAFDHNRVIEDYLMSTRFTEQGARKSPVRTPHVHKSRVGSQT